MVLTDAPIKQTLASPEKSRRVAKWSIELGERDIKFRLPGFEKPLYLVDHQPRVYKNGQAPDFHFLCYSVDQHQSCTRAVELEAPSFLSALKKGSDFSAPFDRNRLSAASFPLRLCMSLSVLGGSSANSPAGATHQLSTSSGNSAVGIQQWELYFTSSGKMH
nr:RVT_3 domain-containing protein [Tanacetum cinerariifolium]